MQRETHCTSSSPVPMLSGYYHRPTLLRSPPSHLPRDLLIHAHTSTTTLISRSSSIPTPYIGMWDVGRIMISSSCRAERNGQTNAGPTARKADKEYRRNIEIYLPVTFAAFATGIILFLLYFCCFYWFLRTLVFGLASLCGSWRSFMIMKYEKRIPPSHTHIHTCSSFSHQAHHIIMLVHTYIHKCTHHGDCCAIACLLLCLCGVYCCAILLVKKTLFFLCVVKNQLLSHCNF